MHVLSGREQLMAIRTASKTTGASAAGTMRGGVGGEGTASSSSRPSGSPFRMYMSLQSLAVCFAMASVFGYGVGKACRTYTLKHLVIGQYQQPEQPPHQLPQPIPQVTLPQPILPKGHEMPQTTYTSRQLLSEGTLDTTTSVLLKRERAPVTSPGGLAVEEEKEDSDDEDEDEEDSDDDEDDEGRSANSTCPAYGQHLYVDIKNVDRAFLDSEERLAAAMIELVDTSGDLTMLSYHCHRHAPLGVSCVGLLLENHIAFHTFPAVGKLTLDIYTCGSKGLRPLLSTISKTFSIAASDGNDSTPILKWSLKNRGYDIDKHIANINEVDFYAYVADRPDLSLKKEVVSVKTNFQTVDVFDVVDPKIRGAIHSAYDNPNVQMEPDRIIYLDHIMQSRRYGEAAYHESLVHPAMFASINTNPKRVAIIGGGEGATLREVLKHRTVETAVMIEIDEIMVNVSRQYLPEWSDCSEFVADVESCFDDPRAEVYYEDAIAWFINQFGKSVEQKIDKSKQFDVIIMDALDPTSTVTFSDDLYDNDDLIIAISNSLTDTGVFVIQTGEADDPGDPYDDYSKDGVLDKSFIPHLIEHGFVRITEYEEYHCGFFEPWSYMIAFKDARSSEKWYASQAETDMQIQKRILPTTSNNAKTLDGELSPLRFFDGALMRTFAYPPRSAEKVFCRRDVPPPYCDHGNGFEPYKLNVPMTSFESKMKNKMEQTGDDGRGGTIYFKESAPKGTYLAVEEAVHGLLVMPGSQRLMKAMRGSLNYVFSNSPSINNGSFAVTSFYGDTSILVNSIMNGTCSQRIEDIVYNPFVDRHQYLLLFTAELQKDAQTGDELI